MKLEQLMAGAVAATAARAVKVAAKVAPKREVDFYRHKAPQRRPWRLDVFFMDRGWLFIEVGQWTLEVAWKPRNELAPVGNSSR